MTEAVDRVVRQMNQRLGTLQAPHHRFFLGTYLRTTAAVGKAIDDAGFEDPA